MPKSRIQKSSKVVVKVFNELMYPIAFISPFFTLPQFIEVWFHRNTSGVSFTTWGGYALGSLVWFIYAVVHKEKPLMIMQFLLFLLQGSIAVGVLFAH